MAEPREQLAEALNAYLTPEQMTKLIDEVLSITKRARGEFRCKSCGKRQIQFVDIPDSKAVALALPDFLNQAYGRPSEQTHQQEPITFIRVSELAEAEKIVAKET